MDSEKVILYFLIIISFFSLILLIFLALTSHLAGNAPFFGNMAYWIVQGKTIHTGNLFNHHGPLTPYTLGFYSLFFGLSTESIYLFSFFWQIITLVLLFFIVKKYFGNFNAMLASAIFLVITAFIGIDYTSELPSTFFGLAGVLFYLLYLEKPNKFLLLFSGFLIAISTWFKQPGIIFLFAIIFHQIYLFFSNKLKIKKILIDLSILIFGVLIITLPLLIYFFQNTGFTFIEQMVLFNLQFKTNNPRIFIFGKLLRLLLQSMGFLFVIVLATPKASSNNNLSKIKPFILILVITILFFLCLHKEIVDANLIQLVPFLIILSLLYLENYKGKITKKIIYVLIIISLLTISLVNLEFRMREYREGWKFKQEQIVSYMKNEIPKGSLVYSTRVRYTLLSGYENPYKWADLGPNIASTTNFSNFCIFIDGVDYIVFDSAKQFLGEENLACAYSKFEVIKEFPPMDEGVPVEILKKIKE